MGTDNYKYSAPERGVADSAPERQVADRREFVDRRVVADRRDTTRFSDVLGRRSGVERRLPVK